MVTSWSLGRLSEVYNNDYHYKVSPNDNHI